MPIGSIIGGLIGSQGAQAAGGAAYGAGTQASQNANAEASRDRAALSPWWQTGTQATGQLGALYGFGHLVGDNQGNYGYDGTNAAADQAAASAKFFTSPGYDFRLQQGVNALDRSASSRGMVLSGAQGKALSDYGQGTGSAEYGNYVNELNTLSGNGMNAASSANNTAANVFNNGNNALFQGGMARANSYQNSANALASGISSGINNAVSLASFGYGSGMFGGGGGMSVPSGSSPAMVAGTYGATPYSSV